MLELSGKVSSLGRLGTLLLSLWLTALWFVFWRSQLDLSRLVHALLTSLSLYFFAQFLHTLYLTPQGSSITESLVQFAFWLPALYGLIFLGLGSTWGRVTASMHLAFLVALSIPLTLLGRPSNSELVALVQLFLSSGVVILGLMFVGRLIERGVARNRDLQALAHTDALTRISNRRELSDRIREALLQAQRCGTIFSVVLLDIDHFKTINDTFGHDAGDEVLREFAKVLTLASRNLDTVGRWGGEEFLVLLPQTALEEAASIASRLRHGIEQHDFRFGGTLTASLGVTSYQLGDTTTTLLKRTDDALYDAKCEGRNRVAVRKAPSDGIMSPMTIRPFGG